MHTTAAGRASSNKVPSIAHPRSMDGTGAAAFRQRAQVVPARALVIGPRGRWYLFEPPGRLRPLTTPRLRLPGGIEVAARTRPTDDGAFQIDVTVERGGRQLVPASADLQFISDNLAVARSTVLDLRTGDRWRISPDCYAAGAKDRDLLMFCQPSDPKGKGSLVAVSPDGARRTLARVPRSLFAHAAYVSPNGKYVVGVFSPGCGPSYSFVVPTNGGVARALSDERKWSFA